MPVLKTRFQKSQKTTPKAAPAPKNKAETFREFIQRVDPRYRFYKHCDKLIDRLQDVADGKIKRLMIFMPPRHGKSRTATQLFPAYFLSRYPRWWTSISSYAADLAYTHSRLARDLYKESGGVCRDDTDAVKQWAVQEGGGLFASGVGGPLTGKGFMLGIIDDPLKNAEQAASQTIRDKQKEWYESTFYTREEPWSETDPNGAIVVIMCMTGDTPVLMANGAEIPLRDIKVGDKVATYDNGQLGTSTVLNHINHGHDLVYRITMTSGRTVRANERHPFLVDQDGELKWVRLKNLTTAHKIVTLKGSGASGEEKSAHSMGAKSPSSVVGSARSTMSKRKLPMDIAPHPSTQRLTEKDESSIDMELRLPSTKGYLRGRREDVPFAKNSQERTCALIGEGNCALITATKQRKLDHSCATTATLPSGTLKHQEQQPQWLNISDFTSEQIESIEVDGFEEVFDVQVDRTENFIANGLVSHNTRWHDDDLAGWLLKQEVDEDADSHESWHVVSMEAIKTEVPYRIPETCTLEPDWRETGEALCPERRPLEKLKRIAKKIGSYFFDALFQQSPKPQAGNIIQEEWFKPFRAAPKPDRIIISADTANKVSDLAAYTVFGVWFVTASGYYLVEVVRERINAPQRRRRAINLHAKWKSTAFLIEDKASGIDLIQYLKEDTNIPVIAIEPPPVDKVIRLSNESPAIESGRVFLPLDGSYNLNGQDVSCNWVHDYIQELTSIPFSSFFDQGDMTSQFLAYVREHGGKTAMDYL